MKNFDEELIKYLLCFLLLIFMYISFIYYVLKSNSKKEIKFICSRHSKKLKLKQIALVENVSCDLCQKEK